MHSPVAPQLPGTVRVFTQRFSSTPLGARLARRLAVHQLDAWDAAAFGSDLSATAAVIVAELAANAATHGRVPGRDFELRLTLGPDVLRIEVSDTRGERRPPGPDALAVPDPLDGGGRGLLLVASLADRWEVLDRVPVGKTVRAEIGLRRAPAAERTPPRTL